MKIVLINPNLFGDPLVEGSYRKAKVPTVSLGLGALAAYVEAHSDHLVDIIDARIEGLDPSNAFKKLQKIDPDIVGVSLCSHESTRWSISFLQYVKKWKPTVHVTLGNHFASLFPQMALMQLQADSIVIGEGEVTFLELVNLLADHKNWNQIAGLAWKDVGGNIFINPGRNFISDINTLPFPKRSLLDNQGENCEMVVEGSRGCAYQCSFCTIGPFYGLQPGLSLRQKLAKTIFNEIKLLCDCYPKLKRVRFVDPEFFVGKSGPARVRELAELIQNHLPGLQFCIESRASSIIHNVDLLKHLQDAGLVRVNMGLESGSQRILDKMNKCSKVKDNIQAIQILRDLKIDYSYGFMMITPWSLDEDIEQNVSMLKQIGKTELHRFIHELSLIPGTRAFEEIHQQKALSWKGDLYYFSYTTDSPRIERYRKLMATMEKQHNELFKNASFIYESIRSFILGGEKTIAENVEIKKDLLFMELFQYCWDAARDDLKDIDYLERAQNCFDLFSKRLEVLLKTLDPDLPIPIPSNQLPKFATQCQV